MKGFCFSQLFTVYHDDYSPTKQAEKYWIFFAVLLSVREFCFGQRTYKKFHYFTCYRTKKCPSVISEGVFVLASYRRSIDMYILKWRNLIIRLKINERFFAISNTSSLTRVCLLVRQAIYILTQKNSPSLTIAWEWCIVWLKTFINIIIS